MLSDLYYNWPAVNRQPSTVFADLCIRYRIWASMWEARAHMWSFRIDQDGVAPPLAPPIDDTTPIVSTADLFNYIVHTRI